MKKTFVLFWFALILLASCQPQVTKKPVDLVAAKDTVNVLLDTFMKAFQTMKPESVENMLSAEGLFCGTDPGEFWPRKTLLDSWKQLPADAAGNFQYVLDKREIRVAKDGSSAIVIEQYIFKPISSKIPVRAVYSVTKSDGKWVIDFISWSLVPKNRDIAKLNKALE